jgi:competence protein ComEC
VLVVTVGAATALIGAGLLMWAGRGRAAATGALVMFCIAFVLLPYAGRLAVARASPLAALARASPKVSAELVVTSDPHPLAPTGVAGPPRAVIQASMRRVATSGRPVSMRGAVVVLAPAAGWLDLLPGQRVRVDGRLQPSLDSPDSTAVMSVYSAPVLLGVPPWWQRAAGRVRSALRVAASGLPVQARGLLPGLVDGDTSGLDPVLAQRFRLAGLTHLTAVSGTNCSILIGAVLLALRRFRVRPALCAAAAVLVLVAFVVVARPSPSVLRSAVMAGIALIALASGRPRQALPSLAAAVLLLLAWQPQLATDAGFAMSALATAALLMIAPGWADALRRHHIPPVVAESFAVAAAAHVVTVPVVAAISGRVSLVAVPANVLAEPVVAPATVLGFLAAVSAPLWLGLGALFAQLAGWPCRWLVWVADEFGGVNGATLPWPAGSRGAVLLLAATVAIALAGRWRGARRGLVAAGLVALVVQIPVRTLTSAWPPEGWIFVACDIGQGDALVLPSGDHTAVEVDAGPDPVAVDRCLHDLGVTDVALLVLTHDHLDHVGGIVGVFHGRRVGRVVTGPLAEPTSGVRLVQSALAEHRLTSATPAAGSVFDAGRVRLDVLGPSEAYHGTRSDPNNSSLVLRATVGGTRILLPGDAEIEAQQALMDAHVDLRADVLKVPHHGSAYSWPPFLAAVHAQVGVISVGLHNDYGHPSPVLLHELAELGVPVRRTDLDGDVAVTVHDGALSTVIHGTRASVVGLPARSGHGAAVPARAGQAAALSLGDARMWACPLVPPQPRAPPETPLRAPRLCCSWAMRSYGSPAQSARSPPPPELPTRNSPRSTAPDPI